MYPCGKNHQLSLFVLMKSCLLQNNVRFSCCSKREPSSSSKMQCLVLLNLEVTLEVKWKKRKKMETKIGKEALQCCEKKKESRKTVTISKSSAVKEPILLNPDPHSQINQQLFYNQPHCSWDSGGQFLHLCCLQHTIISAGTVKGWLLRFTDILVAENTFPPLKLN